MILCDRGILFIISSPSGGGKTTITDHLVKNDQNLVRSISVTTRTPRPQEVDGLDYFFKNKEEFFILHEGNEFLEYAKVFNNYYGTMKSSVEKNLVSGKDVVCCIDWQGAIQLQKKIKNVSIFLLPPSIKTLQDRLLRRGKDSTIAINSRLRKAKDEIVNYNHYDYLLINNNFNETLDTVYSIIKAERKKVHFQNKAHNFVNALIKEEIELFD